MCERIAVETHVKKTGPAGKTGGNARRTGPIGSEDAQLREIAQIVTQGVDCCEADVQQRQLRELSNLVPYTRYIFACQIISGLEEERHNTSAHTPKRPDAILTRINLRIQHDIRKGTLIATGAVIAVTDPAGIQKTARHIHCSVHITHALRFQWINRSGAGDVGQQRHVGKRRGIVAKPDRRTRTHTQRDKYKNAESEIVKVELICCISSPAVETHHDDSSSPS